MSALSGALARLRTQGWEQRTFGAIKRHLGGFEDDELRKILIRAGAVRLTPDKGEWWGLLEKNKHMLAQPNDTAESLKWRKISPGKTAKSKKALGEINSFNAKGWGIYLIGLRSDTMPTAFTRNDTSQQIKVGNGQVTRGQQEKARARINAELALSSAAPNATTARAFVSGLAGELQLIECIDFVRDAARAVQEGDMSGLETTLTSQAIALDAVFSEMARRAALNMSDHLGATETYLRLGLKAQAQCRATAHTLFGMKNPQPIAL